MKRASSAVDATDSHSTKKKAKPHPFFGRKPPIIKPIKKSSESIEIDSEDGEDAKFAKELAEADGITLEQIKAEEKLRAKARRAMKQEIKTVTQEEDSSDDDMIIVEPGGRIIESMATTSRASKKVEPVKATPSTNAPPLASTSASAPKLTPSKPATSSFFTSPRSVPLASTSTKPDVSLDTSIYSFDPLTAIDTSSWPSNRLPYSFVVSAFALIAATRSRISITQILTNLLRVVIAFDRRSLLFLVWLITSRLGPAYCSDLEMGIGSQVLSKAISGVSGISNKAMSTLSKKLGDPGDVAWEAVKSVRLLAPLPPLVVHSLYATLVSISKLKG